jgi:hypothetical protein
VRVLGDGCKNKSSHQKKQFGKLSDNYCNEKFNKSEKNSDLAKIMKNAVEHCEIHLKNKNRVLDRDLFDNVVNFIDWNSLLN